MITQYDTDSPEALEAISAPEPKHIWIHGSITYIFTGTAISLLLPSEGE